MSLKKIVCLCSILFAFPAMAQEGDPPVLNANFRRIGLELSSTNISNSAEYQDSPVTQLSSDSQTVVKGVFDFVLEYNRNNLRWNNSVYAEYGETKVKPVNEPTETNETADKILLSSDYAHKLFKFKKINFGPMVNAEYQTEFTANEDAPRMKVLRAKAGLKLFDGTVIKDLYVAGVAEYDMTYPQHVTKSAGEIGWRFEAQSDNDVKFSTDGYYRKYFSFSRYVGTDLEYDLSINARMDVKIAKTLSLGPYLSYRHAKSRQARSAGSNLTIGVSFAYSDLFKLF